MHSVKNYLHDLCAAVILEAMTFDQVIEFYGSQANLARAIGCTRQNIARWRHDGVPLVRQYQIEEITGGELKKASFKNQVKHGNV